MTEGALPGVRGLLHPGGRLSGAEVDRAADDWRRWLQDRLSPGARVATLLGQDLPAVLAFDAAYRAGLVLCPLHPSWTGEEIRTALAALRPGLLLTRRSHPVVDRRRGWGGAVAHAPADGSLPEMDPGDVSGGSHPEVGPGPTPARRGPGPGPEASDGPAWILWTSGSSGRPKGVPLTPANLTASVEGVRERLRLSSEDRWLLSLHPAHVGGTAMIHRAVALQAELVVDGPFRVERLSALLDDGGVTHLSLVPVMLAKLLEHRGRRECPASVRCILLGGQGVPRALLRRALDRGYPVALTYGLTEASSQVATAPPELVRRKPGTVGPPLPGVRVEIGSEGEIRVGGPTVAGRKGWLGTGDLGRIDQEGHLWITGRISRRIVSGGVTVDPLEVEDVLLAHPSVAAACVLGLPDRTWGERVAALLVLAPAAAGAPEDLSDHLRRLLAPAKRPRTIRWTDALPRLATGKVDLAGVRRILVDREGCGPEAPGAGPSVSAP